ncbi:MAG: peroxiredoxin [Alphaproteobacteria bacterium]|nr:peroxiredoxin [Alphaproteobacteria bacterium]
MLEIGKKVKDFTLLGIDEKGREKKFSLSDFKGNKVLLYFYPADDTPGCTKQACDFRDNLNRLLSLDGIKVVGVSPDDLDSHIKFKEKHVLNFPLLSDKDLKIMKSFDAYGEKNLYGKIVQGVKRSTFLIDENGILLKAWKNVRATGHVEKLLRELS